jgi:hypothetical protein
MPGSQPKSRLHQSLHSAVNPINSEFQNERKTHKSGSDTSSTAEEKGEISKNVEQFLKKSRMEIFDTIYMRR